MREDENNCRLGPAERELESALAALSPARAGGLDPVAAAFAAGRRSVRREARAWRAAAIVMLAIGGAGGWFTRVTGHSQPSRSDGTTVFVKSHESPASQRTPQAAPAQSWLMLRGALIEGGVERLPAASPTPVPTQTMRAADVL
jgi:hypothetical protein